MNNVPLRAYTTLVFPNSFVRRATLVYVMENNFFLEVVLSNKAAKYCGLKWKDMKFQKLQSEP
jgi:hypothetical protein